LRFSIKRKFMYGFAMAFIPVFFLFNLIIFKSTRNNLEKERHETMGTLALNSAVICDEYILSEGNDLLSLQQIVVNLKHNDDVTEAFIVNNKGVIVAHSDMKMIDSVLDEPAGADPSGVMAGEGWETLFSGGRYVVRSAIRGMYGPVKGHVCIVYSKDGISRLVNGVIIKNSILTLIAMGAVMSLTFLLVSLLTGPLRILHQGVQELAKGNLEVNIPAVSDDEIGDLTGEFNIMVKSLKEQEIMKDMFSKYLSPDIAEYVLKNRESISFGGEVRYLSVMFADIRGFTSFSESFPPADIVRFLNSYLTRMVDIIFRHKGTLDKFLGDGVLAIYGAPLADKDHAINAVRSGLDMIRHIEEYNRQRMKWGERPMYIGVGINTGEAIIGNIGSKQRTEYTVIGDTVNTASRLEGLARDNELLITAATMEKVKDYADCRFKGKYTVKNKKDPVDVYLVKGFYGE